MRLVSVCGDGGVRAPKRSASDGPDIVGASASTSSPARVTLTHVHTFVSCSFFFYFLLGAVCVFGLPSAYSPVFKSRTNVPADTSSFSAVQ